MNFEGQVALVTGATRGIGAAIAARLVQGGAIVIGTATSDAGSAKIQEALQSSPGANAAACQGVKLDVTDATACDQLLNDIQKTHGTLSILINNAGITRDNLSMRMKDEEWDAVMQTNLTSVFRLIRSVTRGMMKARYGRIVNITSVVGSSGNAGQANYAAAKAGVAGMTRALAQELASRNITVNCVAPGFIDTDMTRVLSEAQHTALLANIPAGRLGLPEDIAAAVAFLASKEAAYVTGVELHVNGGMYMS